MKQGITKADLVARMKSFFDRLQGRTSFANNSAEFLEFQTLWQDVSGDTQDICGTCGGAIGNKYTEMVTWYQRASNELHSYEQHEPGPADAGGGQKPDDPAKTAKRAVRRR